MIKVGNLTKIYKSPVKGKNFLTDLFNRQYKETKAVDNISFEIGENELVGLIGPNGAGKTTTLKMLSGILYPSSGNVNILGFNPFEKNYKFLEKISFVMGQRNQLIWDLPAVETFYLNKEIYNVSEARFKKAVGDLTEILRAKDLLTKPVKTLSLGERMKMELIAGLIHNPKIIFFDEPTIGLDIFSQEVIRDFIKQYHKEFKATIILTSHYMEDVKRLAKRLIVINKGKILYDGLLKEIVEKYSQEKQVVVTLEKEVDAKTLSLVGKPLSYTFPKVIYKFNRSRIPEKINLINKLLPYIDLTIDEEPIEEIIKTLFRE
ncbi:ABC transporter [Candidatus Roizmanbacteria bacterium RIFCSPHIGHO2_01_FULL_35_10]|uniref:ABC transporter n=1 Tax=Candidatus Roizmanbacteria bacterium RIFCSPLOWO2_01_FULL_35_13 TaxID=1802055 RepID=A0A1F7I8T5_9BACT|nr:MAG: ABC transporter [Candidatus Roizmanbacteria bacterium RIFCSPHIGHO2_01_FULL_35_10]OGK39712.1 MAG: ABC transporter [Candidatus Roizmanbacteria bacterium RIFCSPLOWO2_01_FULL_35_13]